MVAEREKSPDTKPTIVPDTVIFPVTPVNEWTAIMRIVENGGS